MRIEIHTKTYLVSAAALLIIAKRWKQPKCLLHDKWIKLVYPYNVVLYICIFKVNIYYIYLKYYIYIYPMYIQNNELLIYATTWMNLKIS